MLYLDHQVTDGVGARILLGKCLDFFASALRVEGQPMLREKMDWNRAHENLSPPWIALVGDKKLCKRDDYYNLPRPHCYNYTLQVISRISFCVPVLGLALF
jgi:hypothetical protein